MIQRYNECEWCGDEYGKDAGMTKADKGEYVKYADYEKLMEALKKYGDHEPCCVKGDGCNCGFEQALKEAEK